MKNLAPEIIRQRLLIEGVYSIKVTQSEITNYLQGVAEHLDLRTYDSPIIYSPAGTGKDENQGFDAFIPLIDSGITIYIWSKSNFFSIILYTCKHFDNQKAIDYTQQFFQTERDSLEYMNF